MTTVRGAARKNGKAVDSRPLGRLDSIHVRRLAQNGNIGLEGRSSGEDHSASTHQEGLEDAHAVAKDAARASEADVDAVLYEFNGDARETIRGLLHDLYVLAADHAATVSRGYVRGRVWIVRKPGD